LGDNNKLVAIALFVTKKMQQHTYVITFFPSNKNKKNERRR
jgi:hypothetical protein